MLLILAVPSNTVRQSGAVRAVKTCGFFPDADTGTDLDQDTSADTDMGTDIATEMDNVPQHQQVGATESLPHKK